MLERQTQSQEGNVTGEKVRGGLGTYITPEELQLFLRERRVRYIEFDEIAHLDFPLVRVLEEIRALGLPLAVRLQDISRDNELFSRGGVERFFQSLACVDFVLTTQEGSDFSLKRQEVALQSGVSFISSDIGESTKQRMRRRTSPFDASLAQGQIEHDKFVPPHTLPERVLQYQQEGKTIAVVCGTFDVLHPGHIAFLEEVAALGDVLFVFTNSDSSIKLQPKNTQGDRPIHPLSERSAILAALRPVDHVTAFDEPTAEGLFENLHGIVYVKTRKDTDVASVLKEKALVLQNGGGYVELMPLSDMAKGVVLSSSGVIVQFRGEEGEEDVTSEPPTVSSEIVQRITREIAGVARRLNRETNMLSALRRQLRRRFEAGVASASLIEQEALPLVMDATLAIARECKDDRSYFTFLIPELLGSMVGLDIRTVSVQEAKDSKVALKNILKKPDGQIVLFDPASGTISDAFAFEEEFWRSTPYNVNYYPSNRTSPLAKRVFLYPETKHTLGITLRVLLEEYANASDEEHKQLLADEIRLHGRTAFMLFEGGPFVELDDIDDASEGDMGAEAPLSIFPKVIGHGGASVIATSGGAIGFAENTRSGISHALTSGVDAIEVDLVPCKDGWVASHDIKLSVSTEASGLTTEKTEGEIRQTRIKLATGEMSDERLLTLSDVLGIVSAHRNVVKHDGYLLKLDVKFSDPELEERLVSAVQESGIPLDRILMTSGFANISRRIHALCPELPFELNTVEPTMFLTQYELMDKELMPEVFISYVRTYAALMNARVVSMMHFAMHKWGDTVAKRLLSGIAQMGLDSQVWVVNSMREYKKYAQLGASYVLMHNPKLIQNVVSEREKSGAFNIGTELTHLTT